MKPLRVVATGAIGITVLAGGFQGWLLRRTTALEQAMLVVAGLALVYPRPLFDASMLFAVHRETRTGQPHRAN